MAKIQIIDDSSTLREVLRDVLEGAGHTVIESIDGLDAYETLKRITDIELIISDVNMPRMDGLGLIRRLSEDTSIPKIPIFMMTTEVSLDLKTKAKKVGVVGWIVKPLSSQKVLDAIEIILAKK